MSRNAERHAGTGPTQDPDSSSSWQHAVIDSNFLMDGASKEGSSFICDILSFMDLQGSAARAGFSG